MNPVSRRRVILAGFCVWCERLRTIRSSTSALCGKLVYSSHKHYIVGSETPTCRLIILLSVFCLDVQPVFLPAANSSEPPESFWRKYFKNISARQVHSRLVFFFAQRVCEKLDHWLIARLSRLRSARAQWKSHEIVTRKRRFLWNCVWPCGRSC